MSRPEDTKVRWQTNDERRREAEEDAARRAANDAKRREVDAQVDQVVDDTGADPTDARRAVLAARGRSGSVRGAREAAAVQASADRVTAAPPSRNRPGPDAMLAPAKIEATRAQLVADGMPAGQERPRAAIDEFVVAVSSCGCAP